MCNYKKKAYCFYSNGSYSRGVALSHLFFLLAGKHCASFSSSSSSRTFQETPLHMPPSALLHLVSPQILFVVGLAFVIGLERTFRFFFQKHKMKATSFFLGGVFVVLIGWPIVGVVLEFYGFFLLFR